MSDEKGKKTSSCNNCNVIRPETCYTCASVNFSRKKKQEKTKLEIIKHIKSNENLHNRKPFLTNWTLQQHATEKSQQSKPLAYLNGLAMALQLSAEALQLAFRQVALVVGCFQSIFLLKELGESKREHKQKLINTRGEKSNRTGLCCNCILYNLGLSYTSSNTAFHTLDGVPLNASMVELAMSGS